MTHWSGFDVTADRRLLKKLAEGGESALAEVYDIYAERLYDYALLLTSDVHVARDIVHDALIDASRRAPRMRDRRHLRPWLYGAVRRRGMARRRDTWSPPADPSPELPTAYAALAALDRPHRDALCLAYRHDLDGPDLATTLGVSQRRARRRVLRASTRAEHETTRAQADAPTHAGDAEPHAEAQDTRAHADADDTPTPPGSQPRTGAAEDAWARGDAPTRADAEDASAAADAVEDVGATDVPAYAEAPCTASPAVVELVRMVPAVAPPDILRDRVLHTATDPQLARYRSQIVARGGRLIASGLPRQPDAPSQVARRYAVGSVAMVAFLGLVTVGLNVVDGGREPDVGRPMPSWTTAPGHGTPGPSGQGPQPESGKPVALPTDRSPQRDGVGDSPGTSGSPRPSDRTPAPRPSGDSPIPPIQVTPSPPRLPGQGTLTVRPAAIRFGGTSSKAVLTLSAEDRAVRWTARSTSPAVTLSSTGGTIGAGGTRRVTVRLARNSVLQLPGSSTITVTGGGTHTVPVKWSISVL